jgi:magnesium-protoporphyrin O-methyltransferase
MVTCCECEGIAGQFGARIARRDLRRFRRRGPIESTRLLVDDLVAAGVGGGSLLDIGGGIGAIQHSLMSAGAREATDVDVSADYLAAAREEATRLGHADRVHYIRADFVQIATTVADADIVTLDRVICCYPDMEPLVSAASQKARRLLGAVYPRDVWWVRAGVRAANLLMRIRRSAYRAFLHPPAAIDAAIRRQGLERRTLRRTIAWEIVTYTRC